VHFENLGGVVFTAFGLDLAELFERTVEQSREALLVNADVGERVTLMVKGLGLSESGSSSGFVSGDGIEQVLGGEGEEGGLGGGNAVEAPGGVAEGLP